MQEKTKESISALLDGELSEIEIHRLLRQYSEEPSIKEGYIAYQQISQAVQGEVFLDAAQHVSLHDRISAAVEAEDAGAFNGDLVSQSSNRWSKPVAAFAVAASVVVAVVIGVNNQDSIINQGEIAENRSVQAPPVQLVSTGSQLASGQANPQQPTPAKATFQEQSSAEIVADLNYNSSTEQPELRELDAAAQERLRQYLMRHDRVTRQNANVRTATFKSNRQVPSGNN